MFKNFTRTKLFNQEKIIFPFVLKFHGHNFNYLELNTFGLTAVWLT